MIRSYFKGIKITAKQFAANALTDDMQTLTQYWSERYPDLYEQMTDKEKEAVQAQMDNFEDRILKMLSKSIKD